MGGTFHSVGNRLLRRFGSRIGLGPNFTILDPEDAREMLRGRDLGPRRSRSLERRFPKGDVLLDLYSFTINTGRPFAEVLAERAPHFLALEAEIVSRLPALPRERKRAGQRLRLRRPAARLEAPARGSPDAAAAARRRPTTTSSSTSTRTPTGSRARSWTAWRSVQQQRHGRRRRRAGDLLVPRARPSRTSSGSRSAIPTRRPSG